MLFININERHSAFLITFVDTYIKKYIRYRTNKFNRKNCIGTLFARYKYVVTIDYWLLILSKDIILIIVEYFEKFIELAGSNKGF